MGEEINLYVNSKKVDTAGLDPGLPLIKLLRHELKLTGTKDNCDGGCTGACTVLMSRWSSARRMFDHRAVSSCSLALGSLHRVHITTVEGVGTPDSPHPIQTRLHVSHAIQCGYDSPGFVMTMYSLLVQKETITMEDLIENLSGNLSRCNGYRAIIEAFKVFTLSPSREKLSFEKHVSDDLKNEDEYPIIFKGKKTTWTVVESIAEAKLFMQSPQNFFYGNPPAKQITENVVTIKPSMTVEVSKHGFTFDPNVTLTHLMEALEDNSHLHPEGINKILKYFKNIRSCLWRNSTSVQDAVYRATDVQLPYLLFGKEIEFLPLNPGEVEETKFDILGKYSAVKQFLAANNALILKVHCRWPEKNEKIFFERIASRKKNSKMTLLGACRLNVDERTITSCNMTIINDRGDWFYPNTVLANLQGKQISTSLFDEIENYLEEDLKNIDEKFQSTEVWAIVKKLFSRVQDEDTGATEIKFGETASQVQEIFLEVDAGDVKPLGKPVPKVDGLLLATGNAQFVDDIPSYKNELYMEFVGSKKAHAKILKVDPSEALKVAGVKHFISAEDVPKEKNKFSNFPGGPLDETMFAEGTVEYVGHPVGAILAENEEIAKTAAQLVEVEYEDLVPVITMQDGIAAQSFYDNPPYFSNAFTDGDSKEALESCEFIHEGNCRTPRQEHFYEETVNMVVVPENDNMLKIYTPNQMNIQIQNGVANMLGIPANRVTVKCKRAGCSYGGKCFRPLAYVMAGALAAKISGRPIRNVLTRLQDIQMMGQRAETEASYQLGVSEGKMKSFQITVHRNAGWSADCSPNVLEFQMFHMSSVYKFQNVTADGRSVKTNTPSNTAFRGYGCPAGIVLVENMIDDVAEELGVDPVKFREDNYIKPGEKTHYGQVTREDDVTFVACMEECIKRSNYERELAEVEEFNANHRHRKRGLSLLPMRYGVGIAPKYYAQSSALINVHLDGSVNLFVGGVEVGQGFYTKMIQIVSDELEIPIDRIQIAETGTDYVPNPHMSGASSTSDLSGPSVRRAAVELRQRLAPFREAKPDGSWAEWVGMAWTSQVGLSVAAHWGQPESFTNWVGDTKEGNRWAYFVSSATLVVVELDTLTGVHQILKSFIVMDLGEVLNPAIDVVQIEGGFLQGYGWISMEDTLIDPEGGTITRGHDTYDIPSIGDIPPVFDISLLR